MRPLVLSKAHAIVQKRKSPHMLVWNEEAKQNWPKTKNKDTIRSPKEGEALMCSCGVWKLGKSDSKPHTIVYKRRGPHVLIWNETKNKEHHTIAQIEGNPNMLVWGIKNYGMSQRILHDRRVRGLLEYDGEKVVPSPCKHAYTTKVGTTHSNLNSFPKWKENMRIWY